MNVLGDSINSFYDRGARLQYDFRSQRYIEDSGDWAFVTYMNPIPLPPTILFYFSGFVGLVLFKYTK